MTEKYSDLVAEWLLQLGYRKCFFVAGGNIMHLLDGFRSRMECVPFVHEVAAGIAAEAYNAVRSGDEPRAFALVTAGPGLTNIVTALAGAFLESHELLCLGGQVKSSDLARNEVRQRGIQEVDGVAIAAPVCVRAERIEKPISKSEFFAAVLAGRTARNGPVFLEFCLDAQGAPVERAALERDTVSTGEAAAMQAARTLAVSQAPAIIEKLRRAERPVLLLGGGVSRDTAVALGAELAAAPLAIMTTWNGMDRADGGAENYFGRPNTWGQRHANILLQQADVIVALGTRLGMQQTGFNWQAFGAGAFIVQADIDESELRKGHPRVDLPVAADANTLLREILSADTGEHDAWLAFCRHVRDRIPTQDPQNVTAEGFLCPYRFVHDLSRSCTADDVVISASSGGAFTAMMQGFVPKLGQRMVTTKGLASMGYGLSSAIGTALAYPDKRVVCVEGDGGFVQNVQELATMQVNACNLKLFVLSNEGYASIRMTQRNYFKGQYLGCDVRTGLGFPRWDKLFAAYGIPVMDLRTQSLETSGFRELFENPGPAAFMVHVDPEQTYFPKISSRITASGSMESAPLHLMSPDLPEDIAESVLRFLPERASSAAR